VAKPWIKIIGVALPALPRISGAHEGGNVTPDFASVLLDQCDETAIFLGREFDLVRDPQRTRIIVGSIWNSLIR
jgi:hypothetical protein